MKAFKDLEIFAVYTPCIYGEDGYLQKHSIWLTFEKAAQYKENYDKAHEGYNTSKILMDVRMLPDSIKSLFKQ